MFRFLCLLYLLLHSYQISAQSTYCNDKPLSLAFFTYGYLYQDNDTGIDADFVTVLRERTGCQIITEVQPRARTWYYNVNPSQQRKLKPSSNSWHNL